MNDLRKLYKCKATGNLYKVISDNARMKDMTMPDRWVDCVIYTPLHENQYEMFSRWKDDFYDKFEIFSGLTDEEIEEQRKLREEIRKRWETIDLSKETQEKIEEYAKYIKKETDNIDDSELRFPIVKRVFIDFDKTYEKYEKSLKKVIDKLWHEYYKCCEDCVGNGCDDCRDCEEAKKKREIYNKIQKLKNEN